MYAWPSGLVWTRAVESFPIVSYHVERDREEQTVELRWENGGGEYFGIVDQRGNVGLRNNPPLSKPLMTVDIFS